MQHRSTPFAAPLCASLPSVGPSLETICMLQMFARVYKPVASKNGRFNNHSLT